MIKCEHPYACMWGWWPEHCQCSTPDEAIRDGKDPGDVGPMDSIWSAEEQEQDFIGEFLEEQEWSPLRRLVVLGLLFLGILIALSYLVWFFSTYTP